MHPPDFWYPRPGATHPLAARLLAPLAFIYDRVGRLRMRRGAAYRAAVPVICIGNLTAGGTGKTPVALAIAAALTVRGIKPVFLTRGYGGQERGPLTVDPALHSAGDVGDEPLLLARAYPVIVARERAGGAKAACRVGAQAIVMDDGFQNPALAKDLSLVVVDSETGFGNGLVIPAGPLREPVAQGLARTDAVVLLGRGAMPAPLAGFSKPILRATLAPGEAAAAKLRGQTVFAFAGIGRPAKFFETLVALGARLGGAVPFPDHHFFHDSEIAALKARAGTMPLVTTEKDFMRLGPAQREGIQTLPVRAVFDDPAALERLLGSVTK